VSAKKVATKVRTAENK